MKWSELKWLPFGTLIFLAANITITLLFPGTRGPSYDILVAKEVLVGILLWALVVRPK